MCVFFSRGMKSCYFGPFWAIPKGVVPGWNTTTLENSISPTKRSSLVAGDLRTAQYPGLDLSLHDPLKMGS